MNGTLQAIVFDFDGVIANSEPLHLRAFQRTFADHGLALSAEDYYSAYLGYDDIGVFTTVARDRGLALNRQQVEALVLRKGEYVQELLRDGEVLFPGAAAFIRQAATAVPVAIASGAQRHEIEDILDATGLLRSFSVIVAAGDTAQGKPFPDPYARAFELLDEAKGGLSKNRCVAIEDSRWGLESARAAGLRVVGVTNSYPASALPGAELVVDGLQSLTLGMLEELVAAGGPADAGHYDGMSRARA
jgi:beta-phosphoglucomutase